MSSTITSAGKGGTENALLAPKEYIRKQQLKKEESKQGDTPSSIKRVDKIVATSTSLALMVLRYIHRSRRKDGESPFSECRISNGTTKADIKCKS